VSILWYLNERFPQAHLMPPAVDVLDQARQIADLAFCASILHPIVSRIRMPQFIGGPESAAAVYRAGLEAMKEYFFLIEDRLARSPWWYQDVWSVMDAYLYWVFWRVEGAGFNVKPYPRFTDHARRMEQRPAVQRAMAREAEAESQLEAEGMAFRPTVPEGAGR
jgi:glutathione S-transferase